MSFNVYFSKSAHERVKRSILSVIFSKCRAGDKSVGAETEAVNIGLGLLGLAARPHYSFMVGYGKLR